MGLFDFMKKKEPDSSMPPKMEANNLTNPGLSDAPLPPPEFNEPPRIQEPRNIPSLQNNVQNNVSNSNLSNNPVQDDFTSFPEPPTSQQVSQSTSASFPSQEPIEPIMKQESQLTQPEPEIPAKNPITEQKESFELPDFDDEEIEEIENLSKEIKEDDTIPVEHEPVKEKNKSVTPKKINYPKPIMKTEIKEKYTSLNNYVSIKDELNQAIKNIRSTETLMTNHNNTVQEKSDKYKKMTNTLNDLQDKMMIIDNKLFE